VFFSSPICLRKHALNAFEQEQNARLIIIIFLYVCLCVCQSSIPRSFLSLCVTRVCGRTASYLHNRPNVQIVTAQ